MIEFILIQFWKKSDINKKNQIEMHISVSFNQTEPNEILWHF